MNKLYYFLTSIFLILGINSVKSQCYAGYPNMGEVQPAAGAWLPAVPPATPWGNNAPPGGNGIGNINCGYSGILTVPVCANNYITIWMCSGNIYTLSLCSGSSWDSFITLTTGGGVATSPPTFDNDGCGTPGGLSTITFIPTISNSYRLRIRTNPCSVNAANCGILQISINPVPPPPANNDPCGSFSLNPVTTTCNSLATTASFSTQSNPPTAPACGSFAGYDVWYTATVPLSGNISIQTQLVSALNIAMAAYTAPLCSGPFTLLSCNADVSNPTLLQPFLTYSGLTPNSTIYIRVWPESGSLNNGSFQICAYEPIPPINDNPCGSELLSVSSPCTPSDISLGPLKFHNKLYYPDLGSYT